MCPDNHNMITALETQFRMGVLGVGGACIRGSADVQLRSIWITQKCAAQVNIHHGDMVQPCVHYFLKTWSDQWSISALWGPIRSRMQTEKTNILSVTLYGCIKDLFWFIINGTK